MNTLEIMAARYSYRGAYLDTPVPREDLLKILKAGCDAPSGCNLQTTSFIAVDDPQILSRLHAVLRKPVGITAPAMICVLSQRLPSYHGRCYHIQDYSAAIENILLAITGLGYASCWVEGYITDEYEIGQKMAAILGVPEDYALVAYLPVGIPAAAGPRVKKKPITDRVWFNGFRKTE